MASPDKASCIRLASDAHLTHGVLPDTLRLDFEALWRTHPEERAIVMMYGKPIQTPRWQQPYIRDYYYSGCLHRSLPVPPSLQPLVEWANASQWGPFDGVLVNWYASREHYIGPHKDNERELVDGAPILSVSLGAERLFRVRDGDKKIVHERPMADRSFLVMTGAFQRSLTHEVPKTKTFCGRRINVTFRKFKAAS